MVSYQLGVLATPVQIRTGPSASLCTGEVTHPPRTRTSGPSHTGGVAMRKGKAGNRVPRPRRMTKDVPISQVSGAVVTRWRVVDAVQLLLTIRGQTEEVRLVCQCGRTHWILREQYGAGPPRLLATCHNCGTKVQFVLEGARLPNA